MITCIYPMKFVIKLHSHIFMYNTFVLDCCAYKNQLRVSRACEATITIPIDDPIYSKFNMTCMRFTRAMTSNNYNCPLQPLTFVRHHYSIYHLFKKMR